MILIWLKKALKKILPDGKIKNFLIYINHKINAKDCKIKYSFKNNAYVARFFDKVLNGHIVIFPDIPFKIICGVPRETPPYFSGGYIKKDSIVIDAGSFPGDFTVLAAKIVGSNGKVIALEPNPENKNYLEKMLRANGVENTVELLPHALANNNLGVFLSGDNIFSHIINGDKRNIDTLIKVSTISIDDLLSQRNLLNGSKNIVVKMDIEGGELGAFDGACKSLEQGVKFIIAVYHIVDGQRTAEILEDKFKKAGYSVFLINPSHLTLLAEKEQS